MDLPHAAPLDKAPDVARSDPASRHDDDSVFYRQLRRGSCLGDEAFRKELVERMSERVGPEHYGEERAERAECRAERLVREALKRRRWTKKDLSRRPKGDLVKVKAARLREQTTMTVAWIAERLQMGTAGYVNNRLYRWRKGLL
jgi:hypothetical protein